MNSAKTIKLVIEDIYGDSRTIQLASNDHFTLQAGDTIKTEQIDENITQLIPSFNEESLTIVFESGKHIVLDKFFTKTSEGVPTPAIQIGDGTYHAPDFMEGLNPAFRKGDLVISSLHHPEENQHHLNEYNHTWIASNNDHSQEAMTHILYRPLRGHLHVDFSQNAAHTSPNDFHPSQPHTISETINDTYPNHDSSESEVNPSDGSHYTNPYAGDLSINIYKTDILHIDNPNQGLLHYDTYDANEKVIVNGDNTTSLGVHVVVNQDGTFSYDPTVLQSIYSLQDGQNIQDKFSYTITDTRGNSSSANVFITINGASDHLIVGTNGNDRSLDGQGSGDLKGGFGNNVIIGDPGGVFYVHEHPIINICLAVDVSTGMDAAINPYITKFDLMKSSLMELVDTYYTQYAMKGATVNINVIPMTDAEHTKSIGTFTLTGDGHDDINTLHALIADLSSDGSSNALSFTQTMHEIQQWLPNNQDENAYNSIFFIASGDAQGSANPHYYFPDDLPDFQSNGEPMQFDFEIGRGTWNDIFNHANVHSVVVGEHSSMDQLSLINNTGYLPTVLVGIHDSGKLVNLVPDINFFAPEVAYGGDDVIHGGFGTNLIFGDTPNTDNITSDHFGGAGSHNGAGLAVLVDKFHGDKTSIINYLMDPTDMYANARALAEQNHGGNDTIHGGIGHNIIFAEGGNNIIYGGHAGDYIFTGNGNNIIHAGDGVNYIDAGQGQNQIFGGHGNNTIVYHEGNLQLGIGSIDGGDGDNTFLFSGHEQILDLTMPHNLLHNFSHIDLNGDCANSHNQLTLGLQDVFDISTRDNTLFVEGNQSCEVNVQGQWSMLGTECVNDHVYSHYCADAANLFVEAGIQVQMQQPVAVVA